MARSFVSSVLSLAGGTAIAQGIGILALPFITRLYPPEVYGPFVVLLAYGGVLAPVVCARYELAIALTRREASAGALAWGALAVAAGVSALCAAAVAALVAGGLADAVLMFLPIYALQSGALQVFANWCTRQRDFDRLARSRIAQAAATAALSIGFGRALGASPALLVLATVAGQAVALAVLLLGLRQRRVVFGARPHQAWRLLRHYRRVVFFNVPHVLSDSAQASGVPLAVAALFGTQAAAYYAFSTRLLKAPLGLVANAISQVYYQRAAAHRRDDAQLRRDAGRFLLVLAPGVVLALPAVMLVPDAAYGWAFGAAWRDAGAYLRALAPWAASSFLAAPLAVLYVVKERFALDFSLALAGTALAFGTLLAVHFAGLGTLYAMWVLSLSMTLYVLLSALLEFALVIGWARRA